MQYQHEAMNRWGVPAPVPSSTPTGSSEIGGLAITTTTTNSGGSSGVSGENGVITTSSCPTTIISNATASPTDPENNNQPIKNSYMAQSKPDSSPLGGGNSTVSAAADSSDNQPPTPTPDNQSAAYATNQQLMNSYEMQQQQQQHPYPSYMNSYEQYYHPPTAPTGLDYGSGVGMLHQQQQPPQQASLFGNQPSARYHPYLSNGHSAAAAAAAAANNSSSISNSSLSPRVVSSSSPSHNSLMNAQQNANGVGGGHQSNPSTPSPAKHCEKCGYVCATDGQLNEHYASAHAPTTPAADTIGRDDQTPNQFSYAPYAIKEEPSSDILDLDSQKMVYPPQGGDDVLPPMHAMHPLHRPLAWSQEMHGVSGGYMPHQQSFSPIKQAYPSIKQEFGLKQEYPTAVPTLPQFGGQMIKSEFNAHQTRPDVKSFGSTDLTSTGNNSVSSSPSEFPSTTTPQDSQYQQRFEPPTSSLPNNPPTTTKSATWKSNEARRPKTYNCTACNKWFTSSGHLKRHYNTTLHKNAVKSSGQPDPATMPISVHHHPSRDPNSKHHRGQNRQPPPAPPEPPRSPEYTPQFAAVSPNNGFGQSQQQNFQQQSQFSSHQQTTAINSNGTGHPNGLAGPSVHASQPRGLLTNHISTNTEASALEQDHQADQQQLAREDQHHQQQQQYHLQQLPLEEHYQQSQLQQQPLQHHQQQLQQQQIHIISHHHPYREAHHHQAHHHLDTIFTPTPTTTIHNLMEPPPQQQQQYIISPLGINTTNTSTPITTHSTTTTTNSIPSFQHLQLPADHQGSYHTIIGNDSQIANNSENILQLGSSFDMSTSSSSSSRSSSSSLSPQPLPPIHTTSIFRPALQHHQMTTLMNTDGAILQIDPTTVTLASHPHHQTMLVEELQRLSGGVPMYHEKSQSPPPLYSPAVPESSTTNYDHRVSPFTNHRSPQEADIPPPYSLASAPAPSSNPYSPTISSPIVTTTTTTKTKSNKRKRDSSDASSSSPGVIECLECDKQFAKICYLTQHNKTFHSGEQPFRCQKCGKRFQTEDVYELHLERHKSQDKPFKCDVCPKQFHHKTDLRRHKEAIHTGFKAHICETCSKSFCRKDHLRKHSDTHKRVRPSKKVKAKVTVDTEFMGDENDMVMGL